MTSLFNNKVYINIIYGTVPCNRRYHKFILPEYYSDKDIKEVLAKVKELCTVENEDYFSLVNRSLMLGDKVTVRGNTFDFSFLDPTSFTLVEAYHISDTIKQ